MPDTENISTRPRTSTMFNDNFVTPEPPFVCRGRRSSSFALGCTKYYNIIHYKTIPEIESKGVWGAYQTQEEFMTMHFR